MLSKKSYIIWVWKNSVISKKNSETGGGKEDKKTEKVLIKSDLGRLYNH